jgi:Zn-dependent protease with chaperone function
MPRTRVFVTYNVAVNAYAWGLVPPFLVVLYSPVVENLTVEEFTHVLAHEMGHIKLWHTRIAPLLGGGHYPLPPPLGWLDAARSTVTFYYNRRQEMSCDRLGIVGCRSLRASLTATTKMSVGLRAGIPLELDGLARQQQQVATGWRLSHFVGLFLQIPLTHPGLVYRLKAMTEWMGLPLAQDQPQIELAVPVPPQFVEPIEAPVDTPLPAGPGVRR